MRIDESAESRSSGKSRRSRTELARDALRRTRGSVTMKSSRVLLRLVCCVVTFCASRVGARYGSITGTVKDPSGAAVAGAARRQSPVPSAASPARRLPTRQANTTRRRLPAGNYDIDVTAAGFKKYQAKGVDARRGAKGACRRRPASRRHQLRRSSSKARASLRSRPSRPNSRAPSPGKKSPNSNSTAATSRNSSRWFPA